MMMMMMMMMMMPMLMMTVMDDGGDADDGGDDKDDADVIVDILLMMSVGDVDGSLCIVSSQDAGTHATAHPSSSEDGTICIDIQRTLHVLQELLARNWHVESQVGFTMPGASNAATVAAWRALFLDLVALHGVKL